MLRLLRIGAAVLALAAFAAGAIAPARADSGTVSMRITKTGFFVGGGTGAGTMHFGHRIYRLRIDVVTVGTFGAAVANLIGTASNLRTAADIAGTYWAVSAGAAAPLGARYLRLENARGVVLRLHGTQVGLHLSLSLSGATIALQ